MGICTTSGSKNHSSHNPPGCGWDFTYCHTMDQSRKLGTGLQRTIKLAQKLNAHYVQFVYTFTSTRRVEN
eukprot:scaffold118583_cov18-Tisochrysis_lutea.AAC.1